MALLQKLGLSLLLAAVFAAAMPQLVHAVGARGLSGPVASAPSPVAVLSGRLELQGRPLAIGDRRESALVVRDAGGPGIFQLSGRFAGSRLLGRRIKVVLTGRDGHVLFSGPLVRFRRVTIGRLARGARCELHASVELTSTGDDARDESLQGRHASFGLSVDATAA